MDTNPLHDLIIFGGKSCLTLTKKICTELGISPGKISSKNFADGEINLQLEENVRDKHVVIIQNTGPKAEYFLELAFMIDAVIGSSAKKITVFTPYFGYGRQERKDRPRVPISARAILRMLESLGVDHFIFCDLHTSAIQGFTTVPSDHIYARKTFVNHIKKIFQQQLADNSLAVVAPDAGATKVDRAYAERLGDNVPIVMIDKRRPKANEVEVMNIVGEVKNKTCLIIDDIVDTGKTTVKGAEALIKNGAKEVYIMVVNGLFSNDAIRNFNQAKSIKKVYVSDTLIDLDSFRPGMKKIKIISLAPDFAEVIRHVHTGESLSKMFE